MNETDGPELGVLILLSLASQEPMVECCLLGVGAMPVGRLGSFLQPSAQLFNTHPRVHVRVYPHLPLQLLDFRFSDGVLDLELQTEGGTQRLGPATHLPSPTAQSLSSNLLELVHQLFGLHLHRGQCILILC